MGVYSKIKRLFTARTNQADKLGETATHKHTFYVPVQWEYYGREYYGDGSAPHFKGATVTKLRCDCGISKRIWLEADTAVSDLVSTNGAGSTTVSNPPKESL